MPAPNSPSLQQAFATAQACHRQGQLGLAESHYQRVVKIDPDNADAWHLLGVVAYQQGKVDKAIRHYRRAVELRPRAAEMVNNLALAYRATGRHAEAAAAFEQALRVRPEYVTAAYNLGLLHEQTGAFDAAEKAYRQVLAVQPDAANAATNLGNLLRRLGRLDDAAPLLERAHARAPDAATAGNLALLRLDQGRYADARAFAADATRRAPDEAAWWEALGSAARLALDPDGAIEPLQRACGLAPSVAATWMQLGLVLDETGDRAAAAHALARARDLAPAWQRARWAALLALPAIPEDAAHAEAAVRAFASAVDELHAGLDVSDAVAIADAFDAAQATSVFNLHYLPGDHTALQARYAELVARVAAAARPDLRAEPDWIALAHGGRLRVGFVSAHLHEHTIERYFGRWIRDLDRARFETTVWYTGDSADARTAAIDSAVDRLFDAARLDTASLADAIRAEKLDVLVHLDVGMDPRQFVLAAWRLAPVQCVGYGHPVTTGLATIDAYLSGAALERADAQRHYREPLVRLPGLGCEPRAPDVPVDANAADVARDRRPRLLCLQNLRKVPPAFDATLARIAAQTSARLVFFDRGGALSVRFRDRLARALRAVSIDPGDAVIIEPARPRAAFLAMVRDADLVLDTPGFSGGATSLDALAVGTPVVTIEGEFARGRQTAAMLRRLELEELIVVDDDAYVRCVASLLADPPRRERLRAQLRDRAGRLFEDAEVQPAFEAALSTLATTSAERSR